jgi:outer membrane protein assembly factor BamB
VSWPDFGTPYLIQGGGISVQYGGRLTVAPGDTLKFLKHSGAANALQVTNGSTLSLSGTAAKPIQLTSGQSKPTPGDWGGVLLLGGSKAALHNVRVSYPGGSTGSTPSTGIYVSGSSPTISGTTISSSSGDDVDVANGTPVLHYNYFQPVPSGHYGVKNVGWTSGHPLLNADRNWWASNTGPRTAGNPHATGTPVSPGLSFKPWLSLQIRPTRGKPGTAATVSGTGYAPKESVTLEWNYPTSNTRHFSPTAGGVDSASAVVKGVVYVGSNDSKVYALRASTGTKIWSHATGGQVKSSPAVVNGVVYVGSFDYKVYALKAATGAFNTNARIPLL